MGVVISFLSLKGGVGKTTLSASLATDLANKYGKKVLLVDGNYSLPNLGIHMDILCPGETIHDVLGGVRISSALYDKYNVDVIPGNFLYSKEISPLKLRTKLASIKKQYDFIIIDSSPNFNEELLSALIASDELFLVTTPDYPSLSSVLKLGRLARQHGKHVSGLIVNRASNSKYQLSFSEIQASSGVPVLSFITEDSALAKSLYARVPVPLLRPRSNFSREVRKLTRALVGIKKERPFWKKLLFLDFDKEDVNREVLREHFYTSIFKD